MYPDDEKTLTIARRTRKNIDFIYTQKLNGADVEEFTHLLNSMLGMIICLREEYFKSKEVTWQQVHNLGLRPVNISSKAASTVSPKLKQHTNFSQLISKVRHAFAHNCFSLLKSRATNEIAGITVWNIPAGEDNKPENRCWEADLSEQQLKDLAYLFMDYVEKAFV